MIRSTGIVDHRTFTSEDTWLDRYCTITRRTRFPVSFHLLCGIFAMTAVVGRRCRLDLPDVALYPPFSIILIGTSGVGKSKSMNHALKILNYVATHGGFPFFVADELSGTPSGLINRWVKWQREGEPGDGAPLEGAYTCDEMGALVAPITGSENVDKFLMKSLEQDRIEHTTASKGTRIIRQMTISFGFCTTIIDLRKKMDATSFADGFMHRFLIAYERVKPDTDSGNITDKEVHDLAEEAIAIREGAPNVMTIPPATWEYVKALKNLTEEKTYSVAGLSGFWNRYPGYAAKLGAARALSDGRYELTIEDVDAGLALIDNFLYPPLEELVNELSAPPKMRVMWSIADDLMVAGREGMDDSDVKMRTGIVSARGQRDFIEGMLAFKIGFRHSNGRWYRFEHFAPDSPATEGTELHETHDAHEPHDEPVEEHHYD